MLPSRTFFRGEKKKKKGEIAPNRGQKRDKKSKEEKKRDRDTDRKKRSPLTDPVLRGEKQK